MLEFLFFILITSDLHPTSALFVVKANKMKHIARYGDIVQLVCNFPVNDNFNMDQLKASWEYINSTSSLRVEILRLNNGKIELLDHKSAHNRRITMLMDELRNGQAVLEITHVKLSDAGTYRCVLQLGGSDYDVTTLDVQASYENISRYTEILSSDGNEMSLTCQSLGFPEAEVNWQTKYVNMCSPAVTSRILTSDGLYNTSSTIKCKEQSSQNIKCVFWNKALNETTEAIFNFQEHESHSTIQTITTIVIICGAIFLTFVLLVIYWKRNEVFQMFQKKRGSGDLLADRLSTYLITNEDMKNTQIFI
ncbi:programmed cell death 1 ligand 2-like [Pelobates fuscus]|uniref:programmed cell death 1 ligand 2-like n=1 Tax=Pelobates fuscus TaxID=191477 RepID=UPI002FE44181